MQCYISSVYSDAHPLCSHWTKKGRSSTFMGTTVLPQLIHYFLTPCRTFVLHYAPLVITVAAYTDRFDNPEAHVGVIAYTVVDGEMALWQPKHSRRQACFRRTVSTRTP